MVDSVFIGTIVHCNKAPFDPTNGSFNPNFFEMFHGILAIGDPDGKIKLLKKLDREQENETQDPEVQHLIENGKVKRLSKTQFLMPGFIDTHVHAPQLSYSGAALDKHLMEWLNEYTFPAESKLKNDLKLSEEVFSKVVSRLLSFGTTCALYFATKDIEPCKVLTKICIEKGQRALVGKVCMDRNSPDFYVETTEESIRDTKEFILHVQEQEAFQKKLIFPVITPRFIPTCTPELMKGLGELANEHDCHVQSHISESLDEIEFTQSLHPGEGSDAEIFDKFGLLTKKTIMAHGVHCTKDDLKLLKDRGSAISHCPLSNFFFAHGYLETRNILRSGCKIGLGTDVAGGYSPSMLHSQRTAVVASLGEAINSKTVRERDVLDYKQSFFLATLGGAEALSLSDEIGSFAIGKEFDAIIMDASAENTIDIFESDSTEDMLQKVLTLGDDRNILQVFVGGRLVHGEKEEEEEEGSNDG